MTTRKIPKYMKTMLDEDELPDVFHDPQPGYKSWVCNECGSRHSRQTDAQHHWFHAHFSDEPEEAPNPYKHADTPFAANH